MSHVTSRPKRSLNAVLETLMATIRYQSVPRALYTSSIPPLPIRARFSARGQLFRLQSMACARVLPSLAGQKEQASPVFTAYLDTTCAPQRRDHQGLPYAKPIRTVVRPSLVASMYVALSRAFAVLSVLSVAATPSWAVLGGSAESIANDQVQLQAKRTVISRQEYTVHEMSRDDGTLIREYVTPAGKVFGVSWSGPTIPDLSQLLGSYNTEYQASVHPKFGRRRVVAVGNPELVVESRGRMRAFYGRAYLRSMLPSGVTPETVK